MSTAREDTNFLRAIAILLIINSHLDKFYPISFLATGGMIGNSLFFMLASLGLYLSWEKRKSDFGDWYRRRIARIYPATCISVLFILYPYQIYTGSFKAKEFLANLGMLFYPPYWFVQALLIFYIFIYFILNKFSHKLLLLLIVPLMISYGIYYRFLDFNTFSIADLPFALIFDFLVILWGLYLGSIKQQIRFKGIQDFILLSLCIIVMYFHKYLMYKGMFSSLQFIEEVTVFPMLYYFLRVANSDYVAHIMSNPFLGKSITFISMITLELYIVHNSLVHIFEQVDLRFPSNVILFLGVSVVIASAIYYSSQYVQRTLLAEKNTQT